jgi:hypothetical protein
MFAPKHWHIFAELQPIENDLIVWCPLLKNLEPLVKIRIIEVGPLVHPVDPVLVSRVDICMPAFHALASFSSSAEHGRILQIQLGLEIV